MKTLDLGAARDSLSEVVQGLRGKPVVLLRKGKPVALVVPLKNTDLEAVSLGYNDEFLKMLERSERRARTEGTISHDDLCREFGLEPPKGEETQPRRRKRKAN